MGRPAKNIDPKLVEAFAKLGATNVDIADYCMCDEAVIRKRFSDVLAKARANRRIKLREMQWKSAEAGSVAMQIWLGKQELGQTDKVEQKLLDTPTIKLQYTLDTSENLNAKLK